MILVATLLVGLAAWRASIVIRTPRSSRATPDRVAEALGDTPTSAPLGTPTLPVLAPPDHARTCCAFGRDLGAQLVGVPVPLFEIGNVAAPDLLGIHSYAQPTEEKERNGLVYTCRGGWIDTAHVRASADWTVFLALRIAASIERGGSVTFTNDDTTTTVVFAAVPPSVLSRRGVGRVASVLASWAVLRIAIWHELSTWYGYQMLPGFSEQVSAFSIEDLYSDALGIRLASAALEDPDLRDVTAYDRELDGLMEEALRELHVLSLEQSRAVMGSLDGRWWTSARRLPDPQLVLRRAFPPSGSSIEPWRAERAFSVADVPGDLARACGGTSTRPLTILDELDGVALRDLIHVHWTLGAWADESFPFPDPRTRIVSDRDLPQLTERVRTEMAGLLGAGFDSP